MTFLWGRSLLPPSSPQTIFISIFPSYLWIIKNWAVFFKKQVQQGRSSHLCSVTCIYLNYPEQWLKSSDVTPETLVPYFHNWIFSWRVLPSFLEIREHFHSRESQNIWKRYYHPIFLFFFFLIASMQTLYTNAQGISCIELNSLCPSPLSLTPSLSFPLPNKNTCQTSNVISLKEKLQ